MYAIILNFCINLLCASFFICASILIIAITIFVINRLIHYVKEDE